MKNILEYFEKTVSSFPDKIAFVDTKNSQSFLCTYNNAKAIASSLSEYGTRKPIVVFIDKNSNCVNSMIGSLYANDYYVAVDIHSPIDRIEKIISKLDDPIVIYDAETEEYAKELIHDGIFLKYEEIVQCKIDDDKLKSIRDDMVDLDIAYILFTSGSTGTPKGAVINHKSLISYIDWVSNEFDFNSDTVFGSQTALYFSASVSDLYSTLKCGCTYCMIPKKLFLFPVKLVEYLNDNKINTLYWVPTAISLLANWKVFDYIKPQYLKKVLFVGEVMPTKQLNYWINNLDNDIQYVNMYGPTEVVDICTFYIVDRKFEDNESLPIGKHCDNCDVFIVKDDDTEAKDGEEGELLVRTSFMANGYYRDIEQTNKAFVQNPLNDAYPERVYRTGDIVRKSKNGEIMYVSRKDFQIKRNGYRIELGEIEANVNSIEGIKTCACVYDKEHDCLALFYEGGPKDIVVVQEKIRDSVPNYMFPDKVVRIKEMPKNANGKIDRKELTSSLVKGYY